MDRDEAMEWLRGNRSMWNLFAQGEATPERHVQTAQADAAMIQQAYWVVRAHSEGLIDGGQEDTNGT